MKTSIFLIIKIELLKFLKRSDWVSIIGFVCIGFIFALNMRGEGYRGVEDQNALFWVVTQLLTTTTLFIGPVIMAFVGTQMLSSEIDNKSILLFSSRIQNRAKMYIGKSIALVIVSLLFFLLSVGILSAIYFLFTDKDSAYVSGTFFGNNVPELFLILIMNYVFTFLFIPQLALFLGAWLKPLVTIIAVFGITLVCTNTGTLDGVKYFNPMYYMVRMSNDVVSTTEAVAVKASESVFCICMQLILCIMLCLLFALVGAKRMRERDL